MNLIGGQFGSELGSAPIKNRYISGAVITSDDTTTTHSLPFTIQDIGKVFLKITTFFTYNYDENYRIYNGTSNSRLINLKDFNDGVTFRPIRNDFNLFSLRIQIEANAVKLTAGNNETVHCYFELIEYDVAIKYEAFDVYLADQTSIPITNVDRAIWANSYQGSGDILPMTLPIIRSYKDYDAIMSFNPTTGKCEELLGTGNYITAKIIREFDW